MTKLTEFLFSIPTHKDRGFKAEFHRIMGLIESKSIEINPTNSSWEEIATWKMPYLQMAFVKEKLEREGLVEKS